MACSLAKTRYRRLASHRYSGVRFNIPASAGFESAEIPNPERDAYS
jgi:hypothetical protein